MTNRVWIELESTGSHADCEARAAAATAMLRKLGSESTFEWNTERCCYDLIQGHGSYNLEERGHWFNLDFLAMSAAEQEAA